LKIHTPRVGPDVGKKSLQTLNIISQLGRLMSDMKSHPPSVCLFTAQNNVRRRMGYNLGHLGVFDRQVQKGFETYGLEIEHMVLDRISQEISNGYAFSHQI